MRNEMTSVANLFEGKKNNESMRRLFHFRVRSFSKRLFQSGGLHKGEVMMSVCT